MCDVRDLGIRNIVFLFLTNPTLQFLTNVISSGFGMLRQPRIMHILLASVLIRGSDHVLQVQQIICLSSLLLQACKVAKLEVFYLLAHHLRLSSADSRCRLVTCCPKTHVDEARDGRCGQAKVNDDCHCSAL